jgi:hypothetical protein
MDRNSGGPWRRSSNGGHTGPGIFVPLGLDRMQVDQINAPATSISANRRTNLWRMSNFRKKINSEGPRDYVS